MPKKSMWDIAVRRANANIAIERATKAFDMVNNLRQELTRMFSAARECGAVSESVYGGVLDEFDCTLRELEKTLQRIEKYGREVSDICDEDLKG